jgi:dCMP deaminase
MTQRPSLDEYFLEIAFVVGKRATCLRKNVGAVIVRDKRILATGYNGAPSGMNHCLEIGCIRDLEKIPSGTRQEKCRAVHAEQNAIIQAAIHGVSIAGATIYCTHQPCILCAKMIINSNIKRVVYANLYPDTDSLEFFRDANMKVEYIPFKLKSETLPLELKSETSSGN